MKKMLNTLFNTLLYIGLAILLAITTVAGIKKAVSQSTSSIIQKYESNRKEIEALVNKIEFKRIVSKADIKQLEEELGYEILVTVKRQDETIDNFTENYSLREGDRLDYTILLHGEEVYGETRIILKDLGEMYLLLDKAMPIIKTYTSELKENKVINMEQYEEWNKKLIKDTEIGTRILFKENFNEQEEKGVFSIQGKTVHVMMYHHTPGFGASELKDYHMQID